VEVEYKHLTMGFADPEKLPEGANRFGYMMYKKSNDKKDIVIFHLLHGSLHLLSNMNIEWEKLKKNNYAKVLKSSANESISVDSTQINVQLALDCVLYIVYRICEHMGDELSENDVKDIVHSLIGLSVEKLSDWTANYNEEEGRTISSSMIKKLLSDINKLEKL